MGRVARCSRGCDWSLPLMRLGEPRKVAADGLRSGKSDFSRARYATRAFSIALEREVNGPSRRAYRAGCGSRSMLAVPGVAATVPLCAGRPVSALPAGPAGALTQKAETLPRSEGTAMQAC